MDGHSIHPQHSGFFPLFLDAILYDHPSRERQNRRFRMQNEPAPVGSGDKRGKPPSIDMHSLFRPGPFPHAGNDGTLGSIPRLHSIRGHGVTDDGNSVGAVDPQPGHVIESDRGPTAGRCLRTGPKHPSRTRNPGETKKQTCAHTVPVLRPCTEDPVRGHPSGGAVLRTLSRLQVVLSEAAVPGRGG